jgi:uncharacterized protein involved in exopolysaccharide biosynthesis
MAGRDPNPEFEQEGDEGGGFDAEQVKELVGFFWRSRRRRPKLVWSVFATVAGLGLVVAGTIPSTYNSQVRLLAQRDLVLPALGNPSRAVPRDADDPTKNVSEMIMRRDSLIALVKDADLLDRWDTTRAPALRLKDKIFARVRGPLSEENKLKGLVDILEKRILAYSDGQTVTISVDWSDPEMACDLVQLLQKNFLEARYDSSVAVISDAINMLEEHAKTDLSEVDSALADFQKAKADWEAQRAKEGLPVRGAGGVVRPRAFATPHSAAAVAGAAPVVAAAGPAPTDAALALETKRQEIRGVEAEREREVTAVQQELAQAQLTLTPLHPTVVALRQKLEVLSTPSPELEQLKADERALMSQIAPPTAAPVATPAARVAGPAVDPAAGAGGAPAPAPAAAARNNGAPEPEDAAVGVVHEKLGNAIKRYQDVEGRIEAAKIELDITRTAFKYRYTVITPAEVPSKPKKPIAQALAGLSLPIAAFLALLVGTALDLFKGRLVETWQVRRRLKMEVLGELELPG